MTEAQLQEQMRLLEEALRARAARDRAQKEYERRIEKLIEHSETHA